MAEQNDIVRSLINVVSQNPDLLKGFESNPEETVKNAAQTGGIDISGVNLNDVIAAVSPLISGGKLDVNAIAKVAGELFSHPDHADSKSDDEGGLNDILGALGNVFGDGDAHESKKNDNGGIDLSQLGGLAASLFGGK